MNMSACGSLGERGQARVRLGFVLDRLKKMHICDRSAGLFTTVTRPHFTLPIQRHWGNKSSDKEQ